MDPIPVSLAGDLQKVPLVQNVDLLWCFSPLKQIVDWLLWIAEDWDLPDELKDALELREC